MSSQDLLKTAVSSCPLKNICGKSLGSYVFLSNKCAWYWESQTDRKGRSESVEVVWVFCFVCLFLLF